jgi:hypothetical protein
MISRYPAARAVLGAAVLVLATAQAFAAPPLASTIVGQRDCYTTIEVANAEWRSLSHGSRIAAQQHIVTSDGRHLAGSQINYAKVLIDRAADACLTARYHEALAYVGEAQALPRRPGS